MEPALCPHLYYIIILLILGHTLSFISTLSNWYLLDIKVKFLQNVEALPSKANLAIRP